MNCQHIVHTIEPVFDENSRVLILGSFPSPKSRENAFFYGHPQNRFWAVIAEVFNEETPQTKEERLAFLFRHKIALWDTVYECDISGAADSSIKNAVPTDLNRILSAANIKMIFTTGKAAYKYYVKFHEKQTGIKAVCLPSTSPANAAWSKQGLVSEYRIIKEYAKG